MSKFNKTGVRAAVASPVQTASAPTVLTAEGGPGYSRDAKGELFLLAVTNMVGEDTFYEPADNRDSRFAILVRQVAVEDPKWTAGFLGWLRSEGNMRSAPMVGAVEAVRAMLAAGVSPTPAVAARTAVQGSLTLAPAVPERPSARSIVASVLQRADEPGELLAYWIGRYGRAIPKPVKRGVADAAVQLYTQRSALKYDTASHAFRFGDVLDLTHPTAGTADQGLLFKHLLDRRHGHADEVPGDLVMLRRRETLFAVPPADRRDMLDRWIHEGNAEFMLSKAGLTWESLSSWLGASLTARDWEAMIPSMGYMALLRNLRNFDEANVGKEAAARVAAKLTDPAEVARSRQFPMRFLSAYRAAPNLRWGPVVEEALQHSLGNLPKLDGRTLVLVDTSGSMDAGFSKDGTLKRWDAAAVFGLALGVAYPDQVDVVSFSNTSMVFRLARGESLLRALDRWKTGGYFYGGGTMTGDAVRKHWRPEHTRLVILTDEQSHDDVLAAVPRDRMTYTWNLAGYRAGHLPSGIGTRHTFGGLTDASFRMIAMLEAGRNASWPWEQAA